ncbi:putative E3 ubiquitin-protein ligase RF298 isoform X1 [Carex rostrata]
MASAVARATNTVPSSLLIQDKMTRNKRKFRTDQSSPDSVVPVYPLRPTDCPNYGPSSNEKGTDSFNLEHLASMCDMCKHLMCAPEEGLEWEDGFNDADWSELTETRLEEILISNIDMIFKNAINVVSSYGYPEDAARNAVLTAGVRDNSKEPLSALVDSALAVLRGDKELNLSSNFDEDLEKTEKSVLARMVALVTESQPFFSRGDAMWCLLICDMSVPRACTVDYDPSNPIESGSSSVTLPVNETNVSGSQSNAQCEMPKVLGLPTVPNGRPPSIPSNVWSVISNLKPDDNPNSSDHSKSLKEGGKKSGGNLKKDSMLRNKSISLEKSLRALGSKAASKGCKHGVPGNLVLDRKCKYTASDSASGITVKSTFKLSKIVGGGVLRKDAVLDLSFHATKSSSSTNNSTNNTSTSAPTASNSTPSAAPTTDTELSLSLQSTGPATASTNVKGTANGNVNADAKANPDTKTTGKAVEPGNTGREGGKSWKDWVPQNRKDEVAAKLLPHMRELQAQIQDWTDWAQQKVMQATRRLVKDKEELQVLRQEREEEGRLHEERKSLEESTKKKLAEMEAAITKAGGKVEKANAAARRLEMENAHLRHEMEAAKMQAAVSAANCRELSKNEMNSLKKFETWESERDLMKEELLDEKDKASHLQHRLHLLKQHLLHLQGCVKKEEKEKSDRLAQLNSQKKEKEHIEMSARAEENALMVKSENEMQRFKSEIRELEQQIQQLRSADVSSKMAAPRWAPPDSRSYASRLAQGKNGISNGNRAAVAFKARMERGVLVGPGEDEVQRERECVMCLSEEMAVVFLPCAHQVVCVSCNQMHESQGMKDCPSCRSLILRRILVRSSNS